jgi:valyl-tRNA synthetase
MISARAYLEMSKIALSKRRRRSRDDEASPLQSHEGHHPHDLSVCAVRGEEMYLSLPEHKDSIMLESYPEFEKAFLSKKASDEEKVLEMMIKDIRNYKSALRWPRTPK